MEKTLGQFAKSGAPEKSYSEVAGDLHQANEALRTFGELVRLGGEATSRSSRAIAQQLLRLLHRTIASELVYLKIYTDSGETILEEIFSPRGAAGEHILREVRTISRSGPRTFSTTLAETLGVPKPLTLFSKSFENGRTLGILILASFHQQLVPLQQLIFDAVATQSATLMGKLQKEPEEAAKLVEALNQELRACTRKIANLQDELQRSRVTAEKIVRDAIQAREALLLSQQQLALVTDIAPVLLAHCDATGRYKFVNSLYAQRFGLCPKDCVGRHMSDIVGREAFEAIRANVDKVLSGKAVQFESEIPQAGQPVRFMQCSYAPEFSPQMEVVGFVAALTDITHHKKVEQALRESESVLRTVTNEAQVGLVMINREWRYLFSNQTYADILGIDNNNIVGSHVHDVLPPHLLEPVKQRLTRAFAGDRATYETRIPAHPKTGQERFYEVVYEPRTNALGEPYVVVVIVDVTDRKKMQETLEKLIDERTVKLRETIQQLETFSYSIVHDMRAPLRSMRSFAAILEEEYGGRFDDAGRNFLSRIMGSASRMDALINDVLNYSRINMSQLAIHSVNLEKLLEDIISEYPQFSESSQLITVQKPLPSLRGNTALLTQILSNLIGNALKFVAPNRPPQVTIWGKTLEGKVRIYVEDNGIGIAPEHQERIFGLFQRLHREEEYPGTGVGLAIVQKAVSRMNGRVGVESTLGAGSRFWFELPAS